MRSSESAFVHTGVLLALCVSMVLTLLLSSTRVREHFLITFAPSPGRAYTYGEQHLDAGDMYIYDLKEAELFLKEALRLDPHIPFAHHQLARVDFLRGNFYSALWQINRELEINSSPSPSSYYVRGLIEGYMGRYEDSAKDYEHFLQFAPNNWAGLNDYAWVLLKAGRNSEAVAVTERGLTYFPDNPWLLNSSAIALYETGNVQKARVRAERAITASAKLSEQEWLTAYPGNNPKVAQEGIATLRKSAQDNMHMIEQAIASSAVQ